MPSINMIAARRAEKKRIEKMVYVTLLAIVGEVALSLGVLGFMTARVHAANSNIRQLDSQMVKLKPTVERIQRYETEIKDLNPRLELLSQSREQTLLWYTIMHDLASSMPENTWLTGVATMMSVDASASASGTKVAPKATLNLNGTTSSQKLVGEAMLKLNECPEFEQVDLAFTQESANLNGKSLQFQIAAKVRSSASQKGGESRHVSN